MPGEIPTDENEPKSPMQIEADRVAEAHKNYGNSDGESDGQDNTGLTTSADVPTASPDAA